MLRQIITNNCAKLAQNIREMAKQQVTLNLQSLILAANSIAIYHAYNFELDLQLVIENCCKLGKELYQPIAYKHCKQMKFAMYDSECRTQFYLPEYQISNEIKWYNLDLILIPLVAVDIHGNRLGKGGGYYDATLKDLLCLERRPVLCGVGFEEQMVEKLPVDEWDIRLDYFVSESRLVKF